MRLSTRHRRRFRRVCDGVSRTFFCRSTARALIRSANASPSPCATRALCGASAASRTTDAVCATSVPGLFAAGDAASREPVVGARAAAAVPIRPGRSASGLTAGRSAAHAAAHVPAAHHRSAQAADGGEGDGRTANRSGASGRLRFCCARSPRCFPSNGTSRVTQQACGTPSTASTKHVGRSARRGTNGSDARDRRREREVAAMLAVARWICASALERCETRGIHRRRDFPACNDGPPRSLRLNGVRNTTIGWA